MKDVICVMADNLGTRSIRTVSPRKVIVLLLFHHGCESSGLLRPITAKMILDTPTTGRVAVINVSVAMR